MRFSPHPGELSALFLENLIYKSLRRHFKKHPAYVQLLELFIDTTFQTEVGQHIDTNGTPYADGKRAPLDLSRFTLDRYQGCVRYKTCYYSFYLSCALALAYCGYDPDESDLYMKADAVCMRLGEYFQIQDDVLDAFAPPEVLGKSKYRCFFCSFFSRRYRSPRSSVVCLFMFVSSQLALTFKTPSAHGSSMRSSRKTGARRFPPRVRSTKLTTQ